MIFSAAIPSLPAYITYLSTISSKSANKAIIMSYSAMIGINYLMRWETTALKLIIMGAVSGAILGCVAGAKGIKKKNLEDVSINTRKDFQTIVAISALAGVCILGVPPTIFKFVLSSLKNF